MLGMALPFNHALGALPVRQNRAGRMISPPQYLWNRHKEAIIQMYKRMSLDQVMIHMQQRGFYASLV